ncbi:hypothetical protein N9992_00610 [bacterium]|nr:hypothetical protein [bacterium]
MANDKFYGYSPKKEESPSKLDRVNPYEFKKGMYRELEEMGIFGLKESTPEQREKATEAVLKNLEEHDGYYTALVTYETKYHNTDKKPSFKTWLSEQDDFKMKEVDEEFKNDKMVELKEAIKAEVKNILSEIGSVDDATRVKDREAKHKSMRDFEKSGREFKGIDDEEVAKKASKGAKGKVKGMKALEKEEQKLRDQKKKLQDKIFPLIQDFKNKKIDKDKYEKKVGDIPQQIKDINKRLGEISKEQEAITLKEKEDRRSVAETAMDREVHMELLNIIKEQGISLREGSDSIRTYYEIAKIAYMEGLTAGLRGE